jgi:hypothetical protein
MRAASEARRCCSSSAEVSFHAPVDPPPPTLPPRALLDLRRTPCSLDCSPARADLSSEHADCSLAGVERAERRMGFDPHPRLPNAIYSGSLRVWAAA